jgi:porin
MGGEYLNSGPNAIANQPIPTYPDPALGVAAFLTPVEWMTLAGGVYDADGLGTHTGFDTAFHGENNSFTIGELILRSKFRSGQRTLPGVYKTGGWYHSGDWDVYFNDLNGRLPARTHRGNAGFYAMGEQAIWRENPTDETDEQGLGVFFEFGWSPSKYNEMPGFYAGGFNYTGLIPGRDADITGLGFAHASLSGEVQSLEHRYSETVIELFHKVQLNEFISIKPDCQYIFDPGGDGRDAVIVGARLEVSF